jgi:hypothetical protein
MRVNTALADEAQRFKTLEQRRADLRTLANQYEYFRIFETRGEHISILSVIVPDRYLVSVQLGKAIKRTKRVKIVIENRYLHEKYPLYLYAGGPPTRLTSRSVPKEGPPMAVQAKIFL